MELHLFVNSLITGGMIMVIVSLWRKVRAMERHCLEMHKPFQAPKPKKTEGPYGGTPTSKRGLRRARSRGWCGCPDCFGSGGPKDDPCATCHGTGRVPFCEENENSGQ